MSTRVESRFFGCKVQTYVQKKKKKKKKKKTLRHIYSRSLYICDDLFSLYIYIYIYIYKMEIIIVARWLVIKLHQPNTSRNICIIYH
jgi:hypothetical protein